MKTGSSKKIKRLKITASANDSHGTPETSARITEAAERLARGLSLFTNSRWFTTDEAKQSRRMGTVPGPDALFTDEAKRSRRHRDSPRDQDVK